MNYKLLDTTTFISVPQRNSSSNTPGSVTAGKNIHPRLASPQLDGHYFCCFPPGAVKGITAGLLLPVVRVFQRNKPKGIGRPGIRGTTTISAIIKEQLVFDPAWIKR